MEAGNVLTGLQEIKPQKKFPLALVMGIVLAVLATAFVILLATKTLVFKNRSDIFIRSVCGAETVDEYNAIMGSGRETWRDDIKGLVYSFMTTAKAESDPSCQYIRLMHAIYQEDKSFAEEVLEEYTELVSGAMGPSARFRDLQPLGLLMLQVQFIGMENEPSEEGGSGMSNTGGNEGEGDDATD